MIKKFPLINPDRPDSKARLLQRFDHPTFKGKEIYFFKIDQHIIIYSQKWVTRKISGITKLIVNQIEIPATAIQWIVDTIEIKFFKPPAQGGLPSDVFFHNEVIEGEELQINRGVAIGGEGVGGYVLANISRRSYISDIDIQEFAMPDPFLFNYGLLNFLKDLGVKIRRGEV